MANTKIDSIKLGSGSVYDFDLPRDANITISSITASTANLSVVNCDRITIADRPYAITIYDNKIELDNEDTRHTTSIAFGGGNPGGPEIIDFDGSVLKNLTLSNISMNLLDNNLTGIAIKYFNFNCYDYSDTSNPLEIDISHAIYVELCASPENIDNRSINSIYYPEVIVTGSQTEITTISLGYSWRIGAPEDNEHQSTTYLYNKLVIEKFPLYLETHEDTVLKTKLDYIKSSAGWNLGTSTVSTISNILSTTSYFACGPLVMIDEKDFDGPVIEVPSLKLKIKVNELGGASSSRCYISGFMIINTKQEKYYNDLLAKYE